MLLHAYRSQLTDAAFTFGACACCARQELQGKLEECVFPPTTAPEPPVWLQDRGWSGDDWIQHSFDWLWDLNACFSTETYLEKNFYASERLEAARLRASASPDDAIAQNFVRRVQSYIENMRKDLTDDAVLAPGGLHGPWASGFHPKWLFWRGAVHHNSIGKASTLSASLCAKCADRFARKPRRCSATSHQHLMPVGARADGFGEVPCLPK